MKRTFVVLLVLAGCGRSADFSGPAPAGALRCSLEHGLAAGYVLVEGGVERGFLRLAQPLAPPPAEDGMLRPEPEPQLGDAVLREQLRPLAQNQILIAEERGRLTFRILGVADAGVDAGPGSNAEDQARTMLALCTASPPLFPGPAVGPIDRSQVGE
jgi:hypothetical protein